MGAGVVVVVVGAGVVVVVVVGVGVVVVVVVGAAVVVVVGAGVVVSTHMSPFKTCPCGQKQSLIDVAPDNDVKVGGH